jgi:hypothetical protein
MEDEDEEKENAQWFTLGMEASKKTFGGQSEKMMELSKSTCLVRDALVP